jgi:hypothetical protein
MNKKEDFTRNKGTMFSAAETFLAIQFTLKLKEAYVSFIYILVLGHFLVI